MASSLVLHSFVQKLAEDDTQSNVGKALMGVGGAGLLGAGLMAGHNHMENSIQNSIQKQVEQLAKQRGGGMSNVDKALVAAPLLFGGVSWAANKVTAHNQEKAKKIMDEAAAIRSMINKIENPVSSGSAVTARPYTMRSAINEVKQEAQRKPLITPTTDPNAYNVQAVKSAEDDNRSLIGGAGLLAAGGAGTYMHSQYQAQQAAQRAAQEAAAAQRSANIARMKGIGKGVAGGLGVAGLLAGLGVAGNFAKNKVVQGIQNKAHGLGNIINEGIQQGIHMDHPQWSEFEKRIRAEMPLQHRIMGTENKFIEEVVKDIHSASPVSQRPSVAYFDKGIHPAEYEAMAMEGVPSSRVSSLNYSKRWGHSPQNVEEQVIMDEKLKKFKNDQMNKEVAKLEGTYEPSPASVIRAKNLEKNKDRIEKMKAEEAAIKAGPKKGPIEPLMADDSVPSVKTSASTGAAMFPKAEGGASLLSRRHC